MDAAIGFIGAGNMAEALISGLRSAGMDGAQILATNRSRRERLDHLSASWGIRVTPDKAEVCGSARVLVLAVKPGDLAQAAQGLRPHLVPEHLVISVLAGVRCSSVEHHLGGASVIRAMPNLPAAVMASATALAYGQGVADEHRVAAVSLFNRLGKTVEVREEALDAVTAIAGSGPAYVYLFMEALIEAGAQAGLSPTVARDLALQTVYGAAKLVRETGGDPGDLRRRVTSPNGTTMAGLAALEEGGFAAAIGKAVRSATQRATALGR
ncbi:MAG: pyrroline-5-carboxylate reductase [Armatimonadetes bacterium]|nr:pyrroline-5-carboxylate reductase [Armatimonadota bacterium]